MLAQRNKNAIIAIVFTEIAILALFGSIVNPGSTVTYADGPEILFFLLPAIGIQLLTQLSSISTTTRDLTSSTSLETGLSSFFLQFK